MIRATSSSAVTASSTGTTPVTTKSVGSFWTAPASGIIVTSVWVMSIHRLSKGHSVERETSTRVCGEVGKYTLTTGRTMTNDQVFHGWTDRALDSRS